MEKKQPLSLKYLSAVSFKRDYNSKLEKLYAKCDKEDGLYGSYVFDIHVEKYKNDIRCILPQSIINCINNVKSCCIFRTHGVYELVESSTNSRAHCSVKELKNPVNYLHALAQHFEHKECMDYIKDYIKDKQDEQRKAFEFTLSMCNLSTTLARMGGGLGFPI